MPRLSPALFLLFIGLASCQDIVSQGPQEAHAPPSPAIVSAIPVSASPLPLRSSLDTVLVAGTINNSFSSSFRAAAEPFLPTAAARSLAWKLFDILDHRLVIARDVNQGNTFRVLFERRRDSQGQLIAGNILGARLVLTHDSLDLIPFQAHSGKEWRDAQGQPLESIGTSAPVAYRRISSTFGERMHPILGRRLEHTGTDYAAPMGSPIHAIGPGTIVSVGRRGGYGNMIDIRHSDGYTSRYGHMSRFARVHEGQIVSAGDVIGYVGMTGLATGPHLHFEIRHNNTPLNPILALRQMPGSTLPTADRALFNQARETTLRALADAR